MGLFDALFGGENLEQAVARHMVHGWPADRMIQSCLSELVLLPMATSVPSQAHVAEVTRILQRYFEHPVFRDMISICLMRCATSASVSMARIEDGTPKGRQLIWYDQSVPMVPRSRGGITPKMDRLLRTRVLVNRSKGWILTPLYDDGTPMSPAIDGSSGPLGLGPGWAVDIPG